MIAGGVKIGILGGIGPEATAEYYQKLITTLQKRKLVRKNTDYPQIIINSIPAPELINDTTSPQELQHYINGLKELDNFGVDIIAMVCNTIHLHYEELQKTIKTPILDLREQIRKELLKKNIKNTLIIGTPQTIEKGLYDFKEIKVQKPTKSEQKTLIETIINFNNGQDKLEQIKKVLQICQKYLNQGVQTIILGCTEFAVMLDKENIPKINTIDVLVDATINLLT